MIKLTNYFTRRKKSDEDPKALHRSYEYPPVKWYRLYDIEEMTKNF